MRLRSVTVGCIVVLPMGQVCCLGVGVFLCRLHRQNHSHCSRRSLVVVVVTVWGWGCYTLLVGLGIRFVGVTHLLLVGLGCSLLEVAE